MPIVTQVNNFRKLTEEPEEDKDVESSAESEKEESDEEESQEELTASQKAKMRNSLQLP